MQLFKVKWEWVRGQSIVYQALHIGKKAACLQSQPGFVFPSLSFFRSVHYMQPLAKWALIPFETSRCYCHIDKP